MADRFLERTLIQSVPETDGGRAVAPRLGTLTVLTSGSVGLVLVLSNPRSVLGRGETADLRLEEAGVSRAHACFYRNGDEYEIEDLGSSNGTFVDNRSIGARSRLVEGARISLGSTLLRFGMQDEVELAASKRIYELGVRDGLTGLYNRRHLDERLTAELAFSQRHATALALILVDIDHFKRINDEHGHQVGDAVLQGIAGALNSCVRVEDLVARYGGEEFAVLARGVDLVGTKAFAERMRSTIAGTGFAYDGISLSVTASFGIAHNHSGIPVSKASALIASADQALYAAKHEGRNRVCVAGSPGTYSVSGADASTNPRDRSRSRHVETAPLVLKQEASPQTMSEGRTRR